LLIEPTVLAWTQDQSVSSAKGLLPRFCNIPEGGGSGFQPADGINFPFATTL
jgi:hypothetical protein